jgi:Domain of unknown function (DUF4124)
LPFFLKTENGSPTLVMPTADDFIPDKLLPDSITGKQSTPKGGATTASSEQTFYKWKDAEGNWHYGDRPPPGSGNVSTLQVDTNTNIIQSLKIEPEEEAEVSTGSQPKMSDSLSDGQLTIDDAMNVMSDAKAVRDMMESRNDALKAITGDK